ncbi:serine hydrolase [uncultured Hyphomonas sp.]|uniref:serine hydrolase domain-containing protein n=1 Tax=uncultured Hyphomonas sp. TaxID=225298 RepID=UPI002AAB3696|nr:serine hydrolase [uncultured Hyphomonas sp.]
MAILRRLSLFLAALIVAAGIGWILIGPEWRALLAHQPYGRDILFWNQAQRDAGFRMIDRIPFVIDAHEIEAGNEVRELPEGEPLDTGIDLDAYLAANRTAGIVILHNGKIRLERYEMGFRSDGRWTSFSVAKSLTSTLVGAAVKDGAIKNLDDPVSDYIDELKGSAYDGVTVEQVLTMTSGIDWNEDYSDPASDVAQFDLQEVEPGRSALATYMAGLGRAHAAGEVWNYSTGETNLIGVLVSRATGRELASYLSEKIWTPYGMEQDATWLLGHDGHEISGCCIQASVRDFARFGQFMLEGGLDVLPDGWIAAATVKQADIGSPGEGYGYQWWTWDDGAYQADGIFGQGIFIDPNRNLVIASNASWTSALGDTGGEWEARKGFYKAIQHAIDMEAQAAQGDAPQ